MCSSHAFEIRGLRVCLQFVCFVDMSQQPIRHARSSGRTLNRKYQQKIPNITIFLTFIWGQRGDIIIIFFREITRQKVSGMRDIVFFLRGLRCWPSSSRATFYKQKVMPGLLSLRNFSSSTHHTRLKCLLIQSGFNIKIIRVQKSVIFRVHL